MAAGHAVWDAIVAGSGPAGATAALCLASRGRRVLILEKQSWPRYKTCGGGLVSKAGRLLDVEIAGSVEVEAHRAELHVQDADRSFSVTRDTPLVNLTMRADLDEALARAALEAGAAMETSCGVDGLEVEPDNLRIHSGQRVFLARYLIGADGAAGAIAQLAGWAPHRRMVPAVESELCVDPQTHRRFQDAARFDFGVVPKGYAWVFPKRQGLSVGCLSYERRKPDLKAHLSTYLQSLEIQPLERQDHGFVIPVTPRASRLAGRRCLLTGDSAGLADPVTCEGISNAILSGRLAAEAILDCGSETEAVVGTYQRALESHILQELRYARGLARLLYETPRVRRFVLHRLGPSLCEAMVGVITGEQTYRQLVLSPARYLRASWRLLGG